MTSTTDMPEPSALERAGIAEASRYLGVPMPTLRSWERRYNIPDSARQTGSHRRYGPAELRALRLMRDEVARGRRASEAASAVRELLAAAGPAAELVRAILEASKRSDAAAVRAHLTTAQDELGLAGCLDSVLMPALKQVGVWWETGRCDVAQEHLTTEAARSWLESRNARAPESTDPVPIVLACGPADLHTVGLEALGVLLRYSGRTCRVLGARTSVLDLITAVKANSPRAIVIVSHMNNGRLRAVQALRAADALGVPTFYSGNAFNSARSRRQAPGVYLGTSLEAARDIINDAVDHG